MKKYFHFSLFKHAFVKKLVFGTFWLSFGSLISRGLFSLASIVLARILTLPEFGEFGIIKSTIDNFLIFAYFGIGLTTTKFISELKDKDKASASSILGAALSLVLIMSLILATIIACCSGLISTHFLKNPGLQMPLIYGSLALVFIAINGTQSGALLGLQAYRKHSISNMLQGALLFMGIVVGGYCGGVTGAIIGDLMALMLTCVISQILLSYEAKSHGIQIRLDNWIGNIKKIYQFAIPASLSTLIVAPTIWVLNIMLVNEPNGFEELGLYSAVIIFSTAIQMFHGAIGNVLLPVFLSNADERSSKKEFFNYFGSWIISIFIAFPLILFPEITTYILGDKFDFQKIQPILGMSLISTLVITSKSGIVRDLVLKNKMWLSVFSMGQYAITNIILFYFFRKHGAIGFAFSYMISYLLNYLFFVPYFIRKKISPAPIFYSKWNLIIWASIIAWVSMGIFYFDNWFMRSSSSVFFITVIIMAINKLYKEWLTKF